MQKERWDIIRVYHGSSVPIDRIDLSCCKPHKDFGRGFYVTKYYDQAKIWAERIGKLNASSGYVTEFDFHESAYGDTELRILRFEGYDDSWLDFVVFNRDRTKKTPHGYDIVEGPMANDFITRRIELYLDGEITRDRFLEELKFERPTHQICFCTVESLQMLKFTERSYSFRTQLLSEILLQELSLRHGLSDFRATELYMESGVHALIHDSSSDYHLRPWREIYADLLTELKLN